MGVFRRIRELLPQRGGPLELPEWITLGAVLFVAVAGLCSMCWASLK
jgi:hypothetical protein